MVDRHSAPTSEPLKAFKLRKATTQYLTNSVPVHLLVSGDQPILRLEFVFNAGTWYESKKGLSYLSAKLMVEGTGKHTSKQIADAVALYGAFMEVHHGLDQVNLSFFLMEKHLENLLPFVTEILFEPAFPEMELSNLKAITTQTLKVNKEKTQFVASTEFKRLIFGEAHPYGSQYWEEDIEAVHIDNVLTFAKTHLTSFEIFISGSFNADAAFKLLDKYIGKGHGAKNELVAHKMISLSQETMPTSPVFIAKQDAVQSSIRVGCATIPRNHPDFIEFLVVNEILGGFFGSRLMKNIREDKGFTYGIHSSVHPLLKGAYWVIGTDVMNENVDQALDEIEKEITILKTEPVNKEELSVVTSFMMGRFMNSINTPFSLMDKFKTLHFNGLDYAFFDRFQDVLIHITSERVLELADNHLSPRNFTKVVVGGPKN